MFSTAEFAAESGFVDEVVYERVMDERLAKLIDVDKKKLNFVSPSTLIGQLPWTDAYSSKTISQCCMPQVRLWTGHLPESTIRNLCPLSRNLQMMTRSRVSCFVSILPEVPHSAVTR